MAMTGYRFCAIGGRATRCGSGQCAPEGSYCICDPGYEHDRINRYHDNCLMPTIAKNASLAFIGVVGLFACAFAIHEIYRSKSKAIALDILRCASLGGLLTSAYCLAIGLEKRHGPASCVLIILMYWTMGVAAMERMLWSFLSPIFAVTKTDSRRYMLYLRAGMFAIGCAFTGVYLSAIVFDSRNDKDSYNLVVTLGLIITIIEVIFIGFMLVTKLGELLRTIDSILEATGIRVDNSKSSSVPGAEKTPNGSSERANNPIVRYRQQAIRLSRRVRISGSAIGLSALLLVILDLLFRVYPFRFIPYLIIVVNFPIFSIVLAFYCRRSLLKTSSNAMLGVAIRDVKDTLVPYNPMPKESSEHVTGSHQLSPVAVRPAEPDSQP